VPAVEVKPDDTRTWPRIDAGWQEAFHETHQINRRIVKLDTRLTYIKLPQVTTKSSSINGIDVYLQNAEAQLSKREHSILIMLDCINDIMKILLKD